MYLMSGKKEVKKMPKSGDKATIYCGKCKVDTPHTYKSTSLGDFSKKLLGKTFDEIGSGWYCDNCGKRNNPQEEFDEELEDFY